MLSDPLSDVLGLLKPKSWISAGLDAGGQWSLAFGAPNGIKFNAVVKGSCWLQVQGSAPIEIEEGDCFLLTQMRPFVLTRDLSLEPVDVGPIYADATDGIARFQQGGDFFLIGGRFSFEQEYAELLFGGLPPVVHVSSRTSQSRILRWALDQLAVEIGQRQAGGRLMSDLLAQVMLVQVLRLYLQQDRSSSGWMRALADSRLGPAVGAMHTTPAGKWTVAELASRAGMSRSSFAERFRTVVSLSPMQYLARWRMLLASNRLTHTQDTIASIAYEMGYESEAAFSVAFSRLMGRSPLSYRKEHRSRTKTGDTV